MQIDAYPHPDRSAVQKLYAQCGWSAYLQDADALDRALNNSLSFFGAFEKRELVGFARCVGDGEHIVLLQDLLVSPAFQRQGIGSALLRQVHQRYASVRCLFLITDCSDPVSNQFYQKMGLLPLSGAGLAGYLFPKRGEEQR